MLSTSKNTFVTLLASSCFLLTTVLWISQPMMKNNLANVPDKIESIQTYEWTIGENDRTKGGELVKNDNKNDTKQEIAKIVQNDLSDNATALRLSKITASPVFEYNSTKTATKPNFKGVKSHRIADACIIGVQKTGTASIQNFLRINPWIASRTNETWFFETDKNYNRGPEHYANMLPTAYDGQVLLDTTPGYFIFDKVPPRIKKVNEKMKLILSLRDPVTRLISHYTHNRFFGDPRRPEVRHSFEQMVFLKNGSINQNYLFINTSLYIRHFRVWRQYFDLDQFYFVDGEQFIKNPVPILNDIEKFLNIPSVISSDNLVFSKKKGFYCHKKGRRLQCMSGAKGRKHPKISNTTLEKLYTFFRPYNEEFMQYIGRNFTWYMKT